ncbi:MAG: toll/interleukin-1 receptor domain-containing protein, partial [Anaerolineae bacterium]|nr:toll/interleukin-1 receptor domain-containing protein [Anaerolineae bacterium]
MVKVFISHATRDNAVANRIYERLTEAGIRCWLDNVEIQPGADWLIQVEQAVKESSHGLFLLSPAAIKT